MDYILAKASTSFPQDGHHTTVNGTSKAAIMKQPSAIANKPGLHEVYTDVFVVVEHPDFHTMDVIGVREGILLGGRKTLP